MIFDKYQYRILYQSGGGVTGITDVYRKENGKKWEKLEERIDYNTNELEAKFYSNIHKRNKQHLTYHGQLTVVNNIVTEDSYQQESPSAFITHYS